MPDLRQWIAGIGTERDSLPPMQIVTGIINVVKDLSRTLFTFGVQKVTGGC
jgi:hypothetical protein